MLQPSHAQNSRFMGKNLKIETQRKINMDQFRQGLKLMTIRARDKIMFDVNQLKTTKCRF